MQAFWRLKYFKSPYPIMYLLVFLLIYLSLQLPLTSLLKTWSSLSSISLYVSTAIAVCSATMLLSASFLYARSVANKNPILAIWGVAFMTLAVCAMIYGLIKSSNKIGVLVSAYHYLLPLAIFAVLFIAQNRTNSKQVPSVFVRVLGLITIAIFIFAMLQYYILPKDIMNFFGYDELGIRAYQFVNNDPENMRVSSTLSGPNTLGIFAAISIPVAFYIYQSKKSLKIASVLFFTALVALYVSKSRSGLLALMLGLLFELSRYRVTIGQYAKRHLNQSILWPLVTIVAVILILPVALKSTYPLLVRGGSAGNPGSDTQRIESWVNSTNDIIEKPFGHGLGTAGIGSTYGNAGPNVIENSYLQIAYELGVIGLLVWLGLYITIIYYACFIKERNKRYLVTSILVIFMVANMFLPFINEEIVTYVVFTLAALYIPTTTPRAVLKKKAVIPQSEGIINS